MTERSTHLFQAPDPRQTVAGLVLEHSACAAVLQRHRIDFCCGGELSIAEAAEKRGVELDALLHELGRTIAERQSVEDVSLRELPTAELVEHIVARHHDTLRKSLPFVQGLAAKVSRVHGGTNPKLRELDDAVQELSEILLAHLDEEEQELFRHSCTFSGCTA